MRNDAGINGDAQRIEQMAWILFLKVYAAKEEDWEALTEEGEDYTSIIPDNCRWSNWAYDDKSGNALTGDKLLDFVNNTLFPTLKNLDVDAETPIKKSIVKTAFEDVNNYMKAKKICKKLKEKYLHKKRTHTKCEFFILVDHQGFEPWTP